MVQGRAKRCKSDSGPAQASDATRRRQGASASRVGNGPYKTFAGSVCAAVECFQTHRSCSARHCRKAKGGEGNTPSIATGQPNAAGGFSVRLNQNLRSGKLKTLCRAHRLHSKRCLPSLSGGIERQQYRRCDQSAGVSPLAHENGLDRTNDQALSGIKAWQIQVIRARFLSSCRP